MWCIYFLPTNTLGGSLPVLGTSDSQAAVSSPQSLAVRGWELGSSRYMGVFSRTFHGDFCWISHGGWGLMAIEWGFKWGRSDLWDIVGRSYQIYLLVMTITLRSHGPKLYSSMIYDINTVNFYRTVSPTWAGDESAG